MHVFFFFVYILYLTLSIFINFITGKNQNATFTVLLSHLHIYLHKNYTLKSITIIVLFSITIYTVHGQKRIDSLAAVKDFDVFENILKKGHPSLYEYTKQDSLDYLFQDIKQSISKDITDVDLYKKMLQISDRIKDGHLQLLHQTLSKQNNTTFLLF